MKTAIVTGAAGFIGANLTEALSNAGYKIYAVVRPFSPHNERIANLPGVDLIELSTEEISLLPERINTTTPIDTCYHLACRPFAHNDLEKANTHISEAMSCLEAAAKIGCKRWVGAGSQAEYGARSEILTEDLIPMPFSAYGTAKVALCYLSRYRASQLGVEWIWGRIHSVYGKYEPAGRLIPDLINHLKNDIPMALSSCTQNWDYLDACDCASALIALGERGKSGEIYNIANGDYRPLREYVETLRNIYNSNTSITYGDPSSPYISLQPSTDKITGDTGWTPINPFGKTLREIYG